MEETASNALVLTAPPGALEGRLVAEMDSVLRVFTDRDGRWLSPGEAWEAQFAAPRGDELSGLLAQARAAIRGAPVDANIVQGDRKARRKRLLVADMDSTIIGQECIDELADFVGLKPRVAAITERAMRGEIAFEPALRERVALLKGLPEGVIEAVLRDRITLTPGATVLVATMRAHGAATCLVSGGFSGFVDRIAARVGFDASRSNVLEVADGRLSGTVREPILGREAKLATLVAMRGELGLSESQTLAVGDGANDLAMLVAAGLGVAFRAKPAVAAAAAARIDHSDLTALLFLQGYAREEFKTAPDDR
ncbi:MAG TPA: phosphoserine phosphatase SerB [Xanthobacteraceae bacterium]|nr:phosphoserine phosphatase SerB [Xanthobacteraceae bacterium]